MDKKGGLMEYLNMYDKEGNLLEEKDSQRGNVYVKTMPLIKIRKNIKYI